MEYNAPGSIVWSKFNKILIMSEEFNIEMKLHLIKIIKGACFEENSSTDKAA